jgi:elongation factor Ts
MRTDTNKEPPPMANFTIADIKALREQLGTGMVDTKKALE